MQPNVGASNHISASMGALVTQAKPSLINGSLHVPCLSLYMHTVCRILER